MIGFVLRMKLSEGRLLKRFGFDGFPWMVASLAYLISYTWLLVVKDSLWIDDWYFFVESADGHSSVDMGRNLGLAPWLKIYNNIFYWIGPSFFRLLTFILFFASAICCFGIIKKLNIFSLYELRALTLLFLLLPFNSSRVAYMVFHYTSAYFYFYLAWYLLVSYRSNQAKVFCSALFFVSFQMHSLLLFFIFPYFHLLLISNIKTTNDLLNWLKKTGWIALCPIVFWLLRVFVWPPSATFGYAKYHEVSFAALQKSLHLLLFLVVLCLLILMFRKRLILTFWKNFAVSSMGLICIIIGLIPYVMGEYLSGDARIFSDYWINFLGHENWEGRHLTLQPLGFALFIFGFISFLTSRVQRIRTRVLNGILTISVVFNFCFGLEYIIDNAKQEQIINSLKVAGQINDQKNYIFIDRSVNLNARSRAFRDRDWLGLIGSAYSFKFADGVNLGRTCQTRQSTRLVLIDGPMTHWLAVKNWIRSSDVGFVVQIFDKPVICKPEIVEGDQSEQKVPFLLYFLK